MQGCISMGRLVKGSAHVIPTVNIGWWVCFGRDCRCRNFDDGTARPQSQQIHCSWGRLKLPQSELGMNGSRLLGGSEGRGIIFQIRASSDIEGRGSNRVNCSALQVTKL
jgi:hypothetical protein